MTEDIETLPPQPDEVEVGVILAIEREAVGIQAVFGEDVHEYPFSNTIDGSPFLAWLARIIDENGREIVVAFTIQRQYGNNQSALTTTRLAYEFENLSHVILCGMAGGAPNPNKPEQDVHRGDVVVSTEGVFQYDFVKEYGPWDINPEMIEKRVNCSPALVAVANRLKFAWGIRKKPKWPTYASDGLKLIKTQSFMQKFERPTSIDVLYEFDEESKRGKPVERVTDRANGVPRVFFAAIGSANRVLRNHIRRDYLRDNWGILAIEMEAAGVATAAETLDLQYIVVKGIADYCDPEKEKAWQGHAALNAAAVAREIIENLPSNRRRTITARAPEPPKTSPAPPSNTSTTHIRPTAGEGLRRSFPSRALRLVEKAQASFNEHEIRMANRILKNLDRIALPRINEFSPADRKEFLYELSKAHMTNARNMQRPQEREAEQNVAREILEQAKAVE